MTLDYIRNHSNINDRIEWDNFIYLDKEILSAASLESNMIHTRFEFKQKDLLLLKELPFLQDKDYNAFGFPLPKQIILEVLDFHKNHNDEFSMLVKSYPFSQLIFSQWQTIKLYERHKELTNNPKLKYKDFMSGHFSFTYNGKNLNIYEAIAKMRLQEKNNVNDKYYSIISNLVALSAYGAITLYDFIYDIIPNSIKREFLKDESTMKAYLPLKSESFEYTENNFKDKEELHINIYSVDKPFNEKNIKKEWHTINALNLKGYGIDSKELIIPKAKHNKLGIAYSELWELMNINQKDLELPKFQKPYEEYNDSWENIMERFGELIRDMSGDGHPWMGDDESEILWDKLGLEVKSIFLQNNFQNNQPIFEYLRAFFRNHKIPDDNPYGELHIDFNLLPNWASIIANAHLTLNTYIAYRFNQALALAFVSAYHSNKN